VYSPEYGVLVASLYSGVFYFSPSLEVDQQTEQTTGYLNAIEGHGPLLPLVYHVSEVIVSATSALDDAYVIKYSLLS
jgi:hypothetical protein